MKRLLLLFAALCCGFLSYSQLLTWTPAFPKETDPLAITLDATKGNQELLNHTPTNDVYVHIGVITNKSANANDWKYVPFQWATTPPAANASYIGNNKWTYTISGNLRSFFGITDPTETIRKIAILFRSGNGNKAQRNTDGSNMYVPVYTNDLAVRLTQPLSQPLFNPIPETQTWTVGSSISLEAVANKPSAMKLYHNGTVVATSAGNVTSITGTSTVSAAGSQQLVAEAAEGGTSRFDTLNVFVGVSPEMALPAGMQDGINYNLTGTSVTLVLRAPGKGFATVMGDFNGWAQNATVMNKTPDGKFFWITLNGLTPGTEYRYQYVVDGNIKIADPYAEKILDPNNDQFITAATYPNLIAYPAGQTGMVSVLQPSPTPYNWTVNNFVQPDKRGLVIYELLLRDFLAAHDWKTLRDTLSYLKRLGVNAIELMPFNEFEGNISWGYNGFQFFALDKYYGPKNTLKQFIDSAHKAGIAVLMDIVLNHTYGPSPLKELYPMSSNPWYNPAPPHTAISFGDDFNHESADTKYFFGRVLKHWITEYKIDGYRFDFSKGLTQKVTNSDAAMSAYDASRIAIIKGYADSARKANPNAYIILEHFADNAEEKELSDNGMLLWSNVWTQYQEASMGYLSNSNFDRAIHTTKGFTVPHLVAFMESHDEERVTYKNIKYGNSAGSYNIRDTATALKRMELNAAFLLTIPGPKMIWQFGELGYDISRCYLSSNNDETGNCDKKLDPKPIRWDYLQEARRRQVFNTYSELARLRFHPWYKGAFESATIEHSLSGAFKWVKFRTTNDTADLVVIGNFDVIPQTGTVTFPVAGTWYDYFGNFIQPATGAAQNFTLQPGEFHVYINRNVNNVTATPVSNVPGNGTALAVKVYPNPVNASTLIEVNVPKSGQALVELYSSNGQLLRTVYNGFMARGTRQLSFSQPSVAAGTYFLKTTVRGETKTISLTLQ
jgi:1,4-alpha-glucan branching enzyme